MAITLGLQVPGYTQTVLPATIPVPWGSDENLLASFTLVEPGTSNAFRLAFASPYATDTVSGLKTYTMWYQVYDPAAGQMDTIRPLIQSGVGHSQNASDRAGLY